MNSLSFRQKLHEIEKNLVAGGARWGRPLDPPPVSLAEKKLAITRASFKRKQLRVFPILKKCQ